MNPLRARRIFAADGRAVIVAMDHAGFYGPMPGLDDPGKLLDTVARAGADAVLTTYGIASTFGARFGRLGLILRADGGSTTRNPKPGEFRKVFSAADALRLGADAVACMGMIGFAEEASTLRVLTELVRECAPCGLPVMAEMLGKGEDGAPPTAADVGYAMRIGDGFQAVDAPIPRIGLHSGKRFVRFDHRNMILPVTLRRNRLQRLSATAVLGGEGRNDLSDGLLLTIA